VVPYHTPKIMARHHAPSANSRRPHVGEFTPEQLLGPLNPLERLHAPKRLFVAGHAEWLSERPRVSIVGSRDASPEGLKRAARLARLLTEDRVLVVSGLAEGIDRSAHLATMEAGGRTTAVLGTSLSAVYPAKHRALQDQLMLDHLVVSQFPEGHPTTRRNFPMRNRTMALLSDASVIVEAGEGSGSLSQGWEALRLGRPLFLMASILEQRALSWPKTMLDYGAMILKDPAELLARLPAQVDDPLSAIA
jgi:DNA processing protein